MAPSARATIVAIIALFLLTTAPAHAGTVDLRFAGTFALPPEPKGGGGGTVSTYELVYSAGAGEASDLTVSNAPGTLGVQLRDTGAPLTAGENCKSEGDAVRCAPPRFPGPISKMTYDLGDGDDKARFVNTGGTVSLGAGDDTLIGEYAPNPVWRLTADGGAGADTFQSSRPGTIDVSYAFRTGSVTASLDGVPNDGEAGEGDQLGPGVAGVTGGAGNDHLTGSAADDRLNGGPGNDTVAALAGDDNPAGGEGDDTLDGGDGDDIFDAEPGADTVRGGSGRDELSYLRSGDDKPLVVTLDDQPGDGTPGENDNAAADIEYLRGGAGDDRLIGNDGPNEIEATGGSDFIDGRGGNDLLQATGERLIMDFVGGPGNDRIRTSGFFDRIDTTDGELDTIECADDGIGPITGDAFDTGSNCARGLRVPRSKSRTPVTPKGTARLAVECGDHTCSGPVVLVARDARTRRAAGPLLGKAHIRMKDGQRRRVNVPLTKRALRHVRSRRSLRVAADFTSRRTLPAETRARRSRVVLAAGRRR